MIDKTSEREENGASKDQVLNVFLENIDGLRRYLNRYFNNSEDVEDLLQETYMRAMLADKERGVDAPKAFMYKVAKNLAINQCAKAVNSLTDSVEDFDCWTVLLNTTSPEQQTENKQQFAKLAQAVSQLPLQCRQVFVLKKVYGLSNAEIAEHCNLSVSTVDKHLAKGLLKCRNYLIVAGYQFSSR